MTQVTTFLMFIGKAEEAIRTYVALIPDSRIVDLTHHKEGGHGPVGGVAMCRFELAGRPYRAFDSADVHAFTFTPSMSLFVDCADEAELDRIYGALLEGGQALMPLGSYGFSRKFGWLNDRFGVSWQINLP